jgi:hypothetical protein
MEILSYSFFNLILIIYLSIMETQHHEEALHKKGHTLFKDFFQDLVAGTVAGISSTVVGHPLDTMKVGNRQFLILLLSNVD